MSNESITYQNKDIVSKILAEKFRGRSFSVYGIDIPKISDIRPTDLPAVEANELRLDNLFRLEDDSYALVDYESEYRESNKCDYLKYLARVTERLYNELRRFVKIRMIIIYTADVEEGSTKPELDLGGVRIHITEAFLRGQDPEEIYGTVSAKLDCGQDPEDDEMMKMIIYPLTFKGNEPKRTALDRMIELAKRIDNREKQVFVMKLLMTFCDKFITTEQAVRIKEEITMTKFDKLYEESEHKAIEKVCERIAGNLLRSGDSPEKVAENTGLPLAEVQRIQESLTEVPA